MPRNSKDYLSTSEYQDVINRLRGVTTFAPIRETLFFKYGGGFSTATLVVTNFIFWRCGYKGFNLFRYSKGRFTTLLGSIFSAGHGSMLHILMVQPKLTEQYRSENMWFYGMRAASSHQLGIAFGFLTSIGLTFFCAQNFGIIPIPFRIYKPGVRKIAFNFFVERLRPYTRRIALTYLISTACMFLVGCQEFKQSQTLLAKINRKTLSMKED